MGVETNTFKDGKCLYVPNGAAREYAAVGCNFFKGCYGRCDYCYLKRGAPSKQLGGDTIELKKCFKDTSDAMVQFAKEVNRSEEYLKNTGIFFSFSTDPMLKETRSLTMSAVIYAASKGINCKILTKAAGWLDENDESVKALIDNMSDMTGKVAFGFTLTGHDEMEHGQSPNTERIKTMKRIHDLGFKTFASIEPIIDFGASLDMIQSTIGFCDLYKVGLRSGVKRDYYNDGELADFVAKIVGICDKNNVKFYIKDSIRKRLNDDALCDSISVGMDYNLFG